MPRQWTPEARAALAARMREVHAARKAAKNGEAAAALNPISDDVLPPVITSKKASKLKPVPKPTPAPVISVSELIHQLESVPLESVAYSDCGLLLNALSACSTAVALARRQKQEQLEAGTSRAPCKTCGRMIDISKAGGFQILTERDEFHMPRNSFYCSQNCLLARNMPSHARQTPREKKENRA